MKLHVENDNQREFIRKGNSISFQARQLVALSIMICLFGCCALCGTQMQQQAQSVLQQPVKVDVAALDQKRTTGEGVPIQVSLSNGNGQAIGATESTAIELSVTQPSGKKTKTVVRLAPGETSKQAIIVIDEAGLSQLSVRHTGDRLLGSTNYVLVSPARTNVKPESVKKKKSPKKLSTPSGGNAFLMRNQHISSGRLLYAALSEPLQQADDISGANTQSDSQPRLMLRISGETDSGGIRSDGKAFARIQIFHISSAPPTSDITIWLDWSNGDIQPNPLVIKKGIPVAEARWTSRYPVESATVAVVDSYPHIAFRGPNNVTVRFGQPILGIDFVNPPDSISIVDRVDLVARFFDPLGTPIQTNVKRPFRFTSNSSTLRLKPEQDEVAPGRSEFSTVAMPTSIGICNIEASTPGYKSASHKIRVTGVLVLLLCVIGGILGGVLAYIRSNGQFWMRITTGVIVGLVASWAYVYIGLPKANALILHSQISVLFISIVAAAAGVRSMAVITKALGLGF